jgi:hypothetical protein
MREYYLLMLHCHRVYFALHTTSCHQQKDMRRSLAKCYAGYHPNTHRSPTNAHRSPTKMLHRSLPKDTPHTAQCQSLNVHFPCSPVWVESSGTCHMMPTFHNRKPASATSPKVLHSSILLVLSRFSAVLHQTLPGAHRHEHVHILHVRIWP